MADLKQQRKQDPRTGEVYDAGRELDQSQLDKEKLQSAAGLGSVKTRASAETPPEGLTGLALIAWKNKQKKPTAADAAKALANKGGY